jgi:prophage regulatory protein
MRLNIAESGSSVVQSNSSVISSPSTETAADLSQGSRVVYSAISLMRIKEVMARTGLPRSTLYHYIKLGLFPPAHKLTRKCVAWNSQEVEAWILARLQQ